MIQVFLAKIASADGAINSNEADIINRLVGVDKTVEFFRLLLKQPDVKHSAISSTFGTVIDAALQLDAIDSGDFDAAENRTVKCFERMGQTVLAADENVSDRELKALSVFTGSMHEKAQTLAGRIAALMDGEAQPTSEKPSATIEAKKAKEGKKASPQTIESITAKLHSLVGLSAVKSEVETLINLARVFALRKQRKLPIPDVSFHLVFAGNPGTGKTTVARIVADVYGTLGLLTKGHLVEVDRSGLVGNFVGQTANKTKKVIDQARGGVLFIDEAYALAKASENDYGSEAIEVLLKSMEDYRDDLVVIVAGYTDRIAKFLESNPGLRSRFPRTLDFADYDVSDLCEIFRRKAVENRYVIADDGQIAMFDAVSAIWNRKGADFANAREVRNLFESAISAQANRVSALPNLSDSELMTIHASDFVPQ
jgi:SpoVK/Ycf46/Vps4 family AAA+-type ATPase